MEKMQKQGKYKAQKTRRGKLTFDSKKEAERYDALMLLQKAGEIRGLKLQVRYCLQEAYTTFEGDRVKRSTTLRTSCTSAERRLTATDSGTGCRWWRT
nr:MAG TPA: Endonuclease [Caudoviricetes sp.]